MKNATIFVLLLLVLWFSWKHYTTKPERLTTIQTKEIYVVSSEKYGQILRAFSDSIFSPLDSNSLNPVAELIKLGATAKTDLQNGEISEEDANTVWGLCSALWRLNNKREHYETEYRAILNRHIPVIEGGRMSAERKRQYLIDDVFREWTAEANLYRNEVSQGLLLLRNRERQSEFDNIP